MKFDFNNLGKIDEGSIDLKPLTVLVGKNNEGKSWAAYTIGGILSAYSWGRYCEMYQQKQLMNVYPDLDKAINGLIKEGNSQFDYVQFFENYFKVYTNELSRYFPQWANDFFVTKKTSFNNLSIKISDIADEDKSTQKYLEYDFEFSYPLDRKTTQFTISKKSGDRIIYFSAIDSKIVKKIPKKDIVEFISNVIFYCFHAEFCNFVYFFPSERTGIVTLLGHLKVKTELNDKKTMKNYYDDFLKEELFYPVFDLIHTLRGVHTQGDLKKRIEESKNNKKIAKYLEYSDIFQKEILKGDVDFSGIKPELKRELLYKTSKTKQKIDFEMRVVSSGIKDFAPILLYLKYLSKEYDFIVIDEPEMNLHPESQAKIIEFLAMLVNSNIQVIITTHSPYIVDHLKNLMKAADSKKPKSKLKKLLYLKNADAIISKDKVSIYLLENGKIIDILDKNGQINWQTFSQVSEEITQISLDLED
ncbi:MAG: AAA family ATPase [Methanoregula sp.]